MSTPQPTSTATPTAMAQAVTATFVYDGDGNRVLGTVNGLTTAYVGDHYEVEGSTVRKYYYAAGQRIAMRANGLLYWLLGDHLGSTSLTLGESGLLISELRYKAWGEVRYESETTPTSWRYTGQRVEDALGLYYYRARWYDAGLARFVQADPIAAGGVASLDRYSYVLNNPIRYFDPTGLTGVCGQANSDPECDPGYQDPWTPPPANVPRLTAAGSSAENLFNHFQGLYGPAYTLYDFMVGALSSELRSPALRSLSSEEKEAVMHAATHWFYIKCAFESPLDTCGGVSDNAILNWLGGGMESVKDRAAVLAGGGVPGGFAPPVPLAESVVSAIFAPPNLEWTRTSGDSWHGERDLLGGHPVTWGNASLYSEEAWSLIKALGPPVYVGDHRSPGNAWFVLTIWQQRQLSLYKRR